jgi:hypothetical protein
MFKFLFDLLGSPRFEKPMVNKKRNKLKAEKGNAQGGIPPKAGAGRNNLISRELGTHAQTQPGSDLITALVFIQEETGSMVVHFNGFKNEEHAQTFAAHLMKKSGIKYNSMNDLFNLPTIH